MIDSQEKGLVCKLLARQKRTHRIFERLIAYAALRLRRTEVEDFNFSEFEMTTASGHLNKFEPAPGKLDSKVGLLCIRFHLLNPKFKILNKPKIKIYNDLKDHFDFTTIAPKIFVNSVDSCINFSSSSC